MPLQSPDIYLLPHHSLRDPTGKSTANRSLPRSPGLLPPISFSGGFYLRRLIALIGWNFYSETCFSSILNPTNSPEMGKPKQMALPPGGKNGRRGDPDLDGEDGWVIVKKQRVTILIPPLPVHGKSTNRKRRPVNPEAVVPVETANKKSVVPAETCDKKPAADEQEKVQSLGPNGAPVECIAALEKEKRPNVRRELENRNRAGGFRPGNVLGVSSISRTIKRPRLPGSFLDGSLLLNQRLRASLVEKKLRKAGGLSKWLTSLGLEQFVRVFEERSVGKFQLVNLTMKKLKDMGAEAVGPRRKLMHAIDCICQPYCFQASYNGLR